MQFTLMGLKFDLAAIVFVGDGEPSSRGTVQRLSHVSARLFYSSEREGFEERKRRPEISISVFFSSSFSLSLSTAIPFFLFFCFFSPYSSFHPWTWCSHSRWSTLFFCSSFEILLRSLALGRCRATRRCSERREKKSLNLGGEEIWRYSSVLIWFDWE